MPTRSARPGSHARSSCGSATATATGGPWKWWETPSPTSRVSPTIIVNARDLTERHRLQAELRRMSVTDDLTGLNNRRGFFMLAEQEMKLARRLKKDLLLVFVDLDDFKSINDTHGHHVGDQALAETADILRTTFRESDVLARLGGDEFVALAMFSPEETDDVIETRLHQTLAEHNGRAGRRYALSISTGMARFDAQERAVTGGAHGDRG